VTDNLAAAQIHEDLYSTVSQVKYILFEHLYQNDGQCGVVIALLIGVWWRVFQPVLHNQHTTCRQ